MASALERRAAAACEARGHPAGRPTRPFETDACTLWPDGTWGDCCVEHDISYWCGGSRWDRREADRLLRRCAARSVPGWRGAALGALLEAGVILGGAPWLPSSWRWGYGHPFPSRYSRAPVSQPPRFPRRRP